MSKLDSGKRAAERLKEPEATCTPQQAATALQVSKWTIYGWLREMCSDGKPVLPHRKLGNMVRIPVRCVDHIEERFPLRLSARPPSFFSSEGVPSNE